MYIRVGRRRCIKATVFQVIGKHRSPFGLGWLDQAGRVVGHGTPDDTLRKRLL